VYHRRQCTLCIAQMHRLPSMNIVKNLLTFFSQELAGSYHRRRIRPEVGNTYLPDLKAEKNRTAGSAYS
jgi:hypothetical protein